MRRESIIVTGGAGFIGSAVVRHLIRETDANVINIDALTYAANLANLAEVADCDRYHFERIDICSDTSLARVFRQYRPTSVLHLAAETHVDRSIDDPLVFVRTNVLGTAALLRTAHQFWRELEATDRQQFRFHHVSTDEVFGSLNDDGEPFLEISPYQPNSPYAASKAGADHLVRAWSRTYDFPAVISNCSNNYGPFQFPEKFIPLMIINGLEGSAMPVYGTGSNVRDWLFVDDHARALALVLRHGRVGECYNIGGNAEMRNIQAVETICDLLDEMAPALPRGQRRRDLVTLVPDRPGHDARYAINSNKIRKELGWSPQETFATGLRKVIHWYLNNRPWWQPLRNVTIQRLGISV